MKYLKEDCPCGFHEMHLCECKQEDFNKTIRQNDKEREGLLRYLGHKS